MATQPDNHVTLEQQLDAWKQRAADREFEAERYAKRAWAAEEALKRTAAPGLSSSKRRLIALAALTAPAPVGATGEKSVMICPQCEGEGSYADGLDEAACSTECTRCGGNGWIVDLASFAGQVDSEHDLGGLLADKARLDYLDRCNVALNGRYDSKYGWTLIQNHNVNRLMLDHMSVDLNDMDAHGLRSCRAAIDQKMGTAASLAKATPTTESV